MVAAFGRTEFSCEDIFRMDQDSRIFLVCRAGIEIEFCRLGIIDGFQTYVLASSADIDRILVAQFLYCAIDSDFSKSADIEDAHLSSLQEVFRAKFIPGFNL